MSCTPSNISNYLAGVLAYCVIPAMPFKDEKIQMFIKSLKIKRTLNIKNTSILTDAMIFDILETTAKLEHPQVFTALYVLAFLSFFETF